MKYLNRMNGKRRMNKKLPSIIVLTRYWNKASYARPISYRNKRTIYNFNNAEHNDSELFVCLIKKILNAMREKYSKSINHSKTYAFYFRTRVQYLKKKFVKCNFSLNVPEM